MRCGAANQRRIAERAAGRSLRERARRERRHCRSQRLVLLYQELHIPLPLSIPVVSRTASGRGAWLCAENTASVNQTCVKQAMKRRGFERAWKCQLAPVTTQQLEIAVQGLALRDVTTNMEN